MDKKYVLALDQGTTSSRAIIFDRQGQIHAVAQREFEQIFPKPGWVEHDPKEIWSSQIAVAMAALAQAGIMARELVAIGITNQRETTVIWDRETGEPIMNAIVWQDRRTAGMCEELKNAGLAEPIREKTGLVLDAYFSGTKAAWMLDHVEGARALAASGRLAFGTVDSWLIWKLTGGKVHVTDKTNASRTLLCNIHTGDWDDELLDVLRIPRSILPEIRSSSEFYGSTSSDLFPTQVPIASAIGDQQSALFGQLCTKPGMVKNTYGTGCFMLMNTGESPVESQNNLLTTIGNSSVTSTEYALEGSVFIAGAVVQWLRDGLGLVKSAPEIEQLAKSVDDNGGVYFVPAFAGLGAPHWDQFARGIIAGLTRGVTGGHIARAALEGIAYQVSDILEAMEADAGTSLQELRVDGGAAANDLLMQFQADLMNVPVVRPKVLETTALGAAYLAGLAVGFWESPDELQSQWKADRVFEPTTDRAKIDELKAGWKKALERSRNWET